MITQRDYDNYSFVYDKEEWYRMLRDVKKLGGKDDCMIWHGPLVHGRPTYNKPMGYGKHSKPLSVRRAMFYAWQNYLPEAYLICECPDRRCVNPRHMILRPFTDTSHVRSHITHTPYLYDDEFLDRVKELRGQGLTYPVISERLGGTAGGIRTALYKRRKRNG